MRNLFLIIFIAFLLLFSGVFVVDERQNVVVTTYNGTQVVKPTGIYFAWPVIETTKRIYMNERNSLLTLPVAISESSVLQVEVLVNYHVIDPILYFNNLNYMHKVGIIHKIAMTLTKEIAAQAKEDTLSKFNQRDKLVSKSNEYALYGLKIDRVSVVNLKINR